MPSRVSFSASLRTFRRSVLVKPVGGARGGAKTVKHSILRLLHTATPDWSSQSTKGNGMAWDLVMDREGVTNVAVMYGSIGRHAVLRYFPKEIVKEK